MEIYIKKFNELTTEELFEIFRARFEVFIMEQKITSEHELDDKDKESYHLFMKENDKVIAYLRIVPAGLAYDEISLGRVLVLKEYRGKNLGYDIVKKALEYIRENLSEDRIKISAQEYAKDFYVKLGFKIYGEVYMEAGIPHIKMIKQF